MASEEKTINFNNDDDIDFMEMEEKQKADIFDILMAYKKNRNNVSTRISITDARNAYHREEHKSTNNSMVSIVWKKKGTNLESIYIDCEYKTSPNGLYYYIRSYYNGAHEIILVDPKKELTEELKQTVEYQMKKADIKEDIDIINRHLKDLPDKIKYIFDQKIELLKELKDKQAELDAVELTIEKQIGEETKKQLDDLNIS